MIIFDKSNKTRQFLTTCYLNASFEEKNLPQQGSTIVVQATEGDAGYRWTKLFQLL